MYNCSFCSQPNAVVLNPSELLTVTSTVETRQTRYDSVIEGPVAESMEIKTNTPKGDTVTLVIDTKCAYEGCQMSHRDLALHFKVEKNFISEHALASYTCRCGKINTLKLEIENFNDYKSNPRKQEMDSMKTKIYFWRDFSKCQTCLCCACIVVSYVIGTFCECCGAS
eukprot:TRINITY_DN19490_c0_g1_i1.p1 TRINITY_DN19490_c0_g1~~TRINITY_DN19490_c0_g1_i1.p1  ORF type:complete len:168 (-),score=32.04 TRINITY_DN19490_c0_g1_i1:72-575(-)